MTRNDLKLHLKHLIVKWKISLIYFFNIFLNPSPSGISSVSTLSTKTMQSEMIVSEEDEEALEVDRRRKSK